MTVGTVASGRTVVTKDEGEGSPSGQGRLTESECTFPPVCVFAEGRRERRLVSPQSTQCLDYKRVPFVRYPGPRRGFDVSLLVPGVNLRSGPVEESVK